MGSGSHNNKKPEKLITKDEAPYSLAENEFASLLNEELKDYLAEPDKKPRQTQKPKKTKKANKSGKRRSTGTLAVILAVLICVMGLMLFLSKGLFREPDTQSSTLMVTEKKPPQSRETPPETQPQQPEVIEEPIEVPEEEAPETDALRRKGVYTVLVVGLDKASGSTDTMLLACFDTKKGELNVTTLSRDLFVNSEYDVKKLNCIYPSAESSGRSGIDELMDAVSNVTGYKPDNYAVIDIDTAARLVDTIGGLYFDVPQDMLYEDPGQDLYIDIKAGYQMLTGEQAVQVYRFREGYVMGDVDRINVQQNLLMAIVKQTLSLGNIPNLGKIIKIITDGVNTDLTGGNIAYFAKEFLKIKTSDVHFVTMPGSSCQICGLFYYSMDIGKWIKLLNESFNPFDTEIGAKNLDVVSYDGWYVHSTTGTLKGGFESLYGFDDPGFWGETTVYTYHD